MVNRTVSIALDGLGFQQFVKSPNRVMVRNIGVDSQTKKRDERKTVEDHGLRRRKRRGIHVILLSTNPIRWSEESLTACGSPPDDPDFPDIFTNMALWGYNEPVRQIAVEELVDIFAKYDRIQKEEGEAVVRKLLVPDRMNSMNEGHPLVFEKLRPRFEK